MSNVPVRRLSGAQPRRGGALRAVALGGALALLAIPSGKFASAAPKSATLTILQTTDLHGNLLPWDYLRARPADVGLARIASRVSAIRKERGPANVLLLDAGDTIQGTPLEFVHARNVATGKAAATPDPMALAMSTIGYDALAVGNHEFNFGLEVLRKAEKESRFPWLSANTRKRDGSPAFREYAVFARAGVRACVLGLVTPNIPSWEPEANRPGLAFEDPVVTAKRLVPVLRDRERCDLVVVLIHSGPGIDLETGVADDTEKTENRVAALAREVPGIDLLLTGHTHNRIPLTRINGVPIIQPGRWGDVVARVDVTLEKVAGRFRVSAVRGELLPSTAEVGEDPVVAKLAAPYHTAALAVLEEPVAMAAAAFPAGRARLEDTALLDLLNDAQREATGADLSMASLLPGSSFEGLPKGALTVRHLWALYPYENELVLLEVDGAMVKACLENAARYYETARFDEGRIVVKTNPAMVPYNFDVIQGVSYRIDPFAKVGERVKDLERGGRPVDPEDRLTLAVNSYRAQGAGGYDALRGAKVLRRVTLDVREVLIQKLRALGTVAPHVDRNWTVGPSVVFESPQSQPRSR